MKHDAHERPSTATDAGFMQIGDVAARTGLSLRTVRYYEEAGLVAPSKRTAGGFRLYNEADSERLELIKQMKPLGFSLEQMRELLDLLDELAHASSDTLGAGALERLRRFASDAEERCEHLRQRLAVATRFADMLRARAEQVPEAGIPG